MIAEVKVQELLNKRVIPIRTTAVHAVKNMKTKVKQKSCGLDATCVNSGTVVVVSD